MKRMQKEVGEQPAKSQRPSSNNNPNPKPSSICCSCSGCSFSSSFQLLPEPESWQLKFQVSNGVHPLEWAMIAKWFNVRLRTLLAMIWRTPFNQRYQQQLQHLPQLHSAALELSATSTWLLQRQ
ncbi:hypothetical protein ACLKA7_013944 [Drosophila subpalustris]